MSDNITMFLGFDSAKNEPIKIDLTKAPHVLLAGTTGSGKSSLLHLMLAPLVSSLSPKKLELYIGDPKRVEFQDYSDLPQVKMVANSEAEHDYMLKYLCELMDARYTWMMQRGIKDAKDSFLSNIVVVIDEFGDLVLNPLCGKRITNYITRLTQLGRAAGINCILATQHPVVQTVSTTIKANCPTRICLKVSSASNSRVVFDRGGAENLRGCGHGLLLDPYRQGITEFQAPLMKESILKYQFKVSHRKYDRFMSNKQTVSV